MAAVLAAGGAASAARAQSPPVANPHGDYKEDCSLCHSAKGWKPVQISKKFDHSRFLQLAGAHAGINCTQCHKSLDFSMTSKACNDCHADVHNGELGTDCARCHGTRSFVDRNDHIRLHRATRFPLQGAHVSLDCEMCHKLAAPDAYTYVNTPTDCYACHEADFQKTTSPAHATNGFSTDCTQCHDQVAWSRAHFDHNSTGFALTGAHKALQCNRCHAGGTFTGLSPDCVSCHRNDYNGTTDPNHVAAAFPINCTQCHNTTRWSGATFSHAAFPIYTGTHAGRWSKCSDCHDNAASYVDFNCLSCHAHSNKTETDNQHQGRSGYSYTSGACYSCHPTGRAG